MRRCESCGAKGGIEWVVTYKSLITRKTFSQALCDDCYETLAKDKHIKIMRMSPLYDEPTEDDLRSDKGDRDYHEAVDEGRA